MPTTLNPTPLTPRRRLKLLFLFAFPSLLLLAYLAHPRTKSCPSACVAFIGDSITSNWPALHPPNQLSGLQIINRGLPGDTTVNMLSRFRHDIVQLRPQVVVIFGGLNDFDRTPLSAVEQNLAVMAHIADEHNIRVILATLPPAHYRSPQSLPAREQTNDEFISAFNAWIRSFAAQNRYTLLDYYSVLSSDRCFYKEGLTTDGVHPTAEGYALMEPPLREAVQSALK